MESLVYLLIAILLSTCYDIMMKSTVKDKSDMSVKMNVSGYTESPEVKTARIIKERLLKLYHSEIDDKRDKIVRLLVQLERVEDPDVFFSNNDHIRSYIFNANT